MVVLGIIIGFGAYLIHDVWVGTKDVIIEKIREGYKKNG